MLLPNSIFVNLLLVDFTIVDYLFFVKNFDGYISGDCFKPIETNIT